MHVYRYKLVPNVGRASARPRHGALLRVDDGFADIHPWPELGDAPLDEQLALLARGETTPLTRASLRLAKLDADARRRGVSLFEGLTIPLSHWPGNDPPAAFDTIKTKGVTEFPENVRIRIDFNARLTPEELERIAETLPKERIDFIEDPCPYDDRTWRALRNRTGLKLAYDLPPTANRQPPTEYDLLVHKPALQTDWPSHNDIVVTSYMDHPVGQFGAAYIAATHETNARCGLFTHVLYEPDAFLERIESDGARLLPPRGTGIGFDDLLERLPWISIG
ncbi:MAG TPA: enolase C-terminal domain-like protein [Thermoanaerobaculia bacterium]|nr:enolase C-terminal domain-like protein [Thermoanaerobaculia bacterium]